MSRSLLVRLGVALALVVSAAGFASCVAMECAGHDTVAWVRGALQTQLEAPVDRVAEAAAKVLQAMRFTDVVSRADVLSGVVTARTASGAKVTVQLSALPDRRTRIDIRVGVINDKVAALDVLARIKRNL